MCFIGTYLESKNVKKRLLQSLGVGISHVTVSFFFLERYEEGMEVSGRVEKGFSAEADILFLE